MNCPICGNKLRPSKKDPSYGLCDNCRKKFKLNKKPKTASSNSSKPAKPASKAAIDDNRPKKRKKKKNNKIKFLIALLLLIVVVVAALKLFGKEDSKEEVTNTNQTTESDTSDTHSKPQDGYGIGDTVEQNDVAITWVSATESSGGELVSPSDGNIFLICEFDIANNSDLDISINSLSNIEAFCGDYSVSEDITGLLVPEADGKNTLDGTIAAGNTLSGIVIYQIPSDYTQMELRVAPDFWGNESVNFVALK